MVITVVANPVISNMSQRDFHDEQVTKTTTTTMTTSSQVQVAPECSTSLSLPTMTSSGPTDRQHRDRSNEFREEGDEDQQVSDSNFSDGNNQGLASPLSASFSFNSYQDILCSASGPGCTFSASDVKRTLSNNHNTIKTTSQTFKSPVGTLFRSEVTNIKRQQPTQQLHQQIVNSKPVNFRLHSRQKSIGKLNELLNPQKSLVVNLVPIEQRSNKQQQQHLQSPVPHSTQSTNSSNNPQIELDQTKISAQSLEETKTDKILNQDHPDEEKYDLKLEMSQTIQSIQSLSMQLNQASNLRGSSLSELSQMSSIGPQSANGVVVDHHQHQQQQQQQQLQENFMTASSGKLARMVGKKASRVKELVLQNLGKADKTTDDMFQMYEENFYKQQNHALKLQKEFKIYINALKDAHIASKSLNGCIQQSTGDYQSARHDLVCENLSQLEHLNDDLLDKLRSQVLVSVNEYTSQFTKLREKISKRKRKLIDYDSSKRVYELMLASINKRRAQVQRGQQERELQNQQRQQEQQQAQVSSHTLSRFILGSSHNNQANGSIQSATNQLIDEARLLKLREQYNYCKIMYETINNELYEELPMVYEKKMKHLLMTLQNYFSIEAQYHSNAGKLYATASDVIDELPMSIHSAHKRNNINHHHHHHQSSNMNHSSSSSGSHTNVNDGEEYNSKVAQITSGSSGVGSSRGDSSLESSSSPEAASSSGNSSPSHQQVRRTEKEHENGGGGDDDEGENDVYEDDNENEDQDGMNHVVDDAVDNDDDDENIDTNVTIEDNSNTGIKVIGVKKQLDMSQSSQEDNSTASGKEQTFPKQEKFSGVVCSDESSNGRVEQRGIIQSCLDHQFSNMQQVISQNLKEELKAVVKGKEALKNKVSNEIVFEDSREGQEDERIDRDKESELNVDLETGMEQKISSSIKSNDTQNEADKISDFKCLYKVKTIYKYLAEDVDELCFEADEIIQVIEFDETEEQEEGWLKGIREVSGQVGLFPANFTQPI